MIIRILLLCGALMVPLVAATQAQAVVPVVSDSRIKTLVYNPNDVYSLLTHYGYQSNIEFAARETVQTVSVGDRVAWQIIPAGRRLFIKAMEEGAHTNMTVVTNKRAYQFDLRSSTRTPLHPSEELVYVVRFFYPQEQPVQSAPQAYRAPAPAPVQAAPVAAVQSMPMSAAAVVAAPQALNYQYTLSGPDAVAPVRVYDDGRATYLRFRTELATPVQVFAPIAGGRLQPLAVSRNAQGELVVNTVQSRLIVRSGAQQVIVYNESKPTA